MTMSHSKIQKENNFQPEGHVSRIRGEEIEQAVLDVARKMAVGPVGRV